MCVHTKVCASNTVCAKKPSPYLPAVLGQCPNAINKKRMLSKGEVSNRFRYQYGSGNKRKNISSMIPNLDCSNSIMEVNNNSVVANPYSSDSTFHLRLSSDENHITDWRKKKKLWYM